MKKNIFRVIIIILLILTFVRIFRFSNQDGEASKNVSREVTEFVTKNVKKIQKMEPAQKENTLDKIEKVIRKCAHFSIYTLVGILMFALMNTYNLKVRTRVVTSLLVGIVYASSDEIHQAFVPGRSAMFTDVLIDASGVCVGIAITALILLVAKNIIKKTKKEEAGGYKY